MMSCWYRFLVMISDGEIECYSRWYRGGFDVVCTAASLCTYRDKYSSKESTSPTTHQDPLILHVLSVCPTPEGNWVATLTPTFPPDLSTLDDDPRPQQWQDVLLIEFSQFGD